MALNLLNLVKNKILNSNFVKSINVMNDIINTTEKNLKLYENINEKADNFLRKIIEAEIKSVFFSYLAYDWKLDDESYINIFINLNYLENYKTLRDFLLDNFHIDTCTDKVIDEGFFYIDLFNEYTYFADKEQFLLYINTDLETDFRTVLAAGKYFQEKYGDSYSEHLGYFKSTFKGYNTMENLSKKDIEKIFIKEHGLKEDWELGEADYEYVLTLIKRYNIDVIRECFRIDSESLCPIQAGYVYNQGEKYFCNEEDLIKFFNTTFNQNLKTVHEVFKYHYTNSLPNSNDGIIRVTIDDTLYYTEWSY
ncbi:MAG: hypothetical protein [Bacteriophage sp.]|nr:MAG: hypothetical protein [Bacteriophage sp.]